MHGRAIIFIEIKAGFIILKYYNSIVLVTIEVFPFNKININKVEKCTL
jgi:hypothetical protein